jgi:hypothetical protein
MPIEVPCPRCRFLFRADDEFAGESAPCPYCGANIVVPHSRPCEITDSIRRQGPASDERVCRDTSEGISVPFKGRVPIPHSVDIRTLEVLEPDEDRPPHPEERWFATQAPPGPRTQAVVGFLTGVLCGLLYWGVALWHSEEQPYAAAVVGLCGCYFILWAVLTFRSTWPKRHAIDGREEESGQDQPIGTTKPNYWYSLWVVVFTVLLVFVFYMAYHGTIIVLAILPGWDLFLYLVVPPRHRRRYFLCSSVNALPFWIRPRPGEHE